MHFDKTFLLFFKRLIIEHKVSHLNCIQLYYYNKNVIIFVTENKAVGVMKPGHTFTIEPMISQGKIIIK